MKNLLYIPIDVPKIPAIPEILGTFSDTTHWAYWKFMRLTEQKPNPYQLSDWTMDTRQKFPSLINWFEHLPFANLRNVKINYQCTAVGGHIDFTKPDDDKDLWQNNNQNEPCGYRIVVTGNRDRGLWVQKTDNTREYCKLPNETDTYVLNHTAGYHGVDSDTDRYTIFCHAEIDAVQHQKILEKSLAKFSKYAVWDVGGK